MAELADRVVRTVTPIVALDVADERAAQRLVERLGNSCDYYKVGLELFTAGGPTIVDWLRSQNKRVFVDLKLHDIPNTVRSAARRVAERGASLLTVHASGGVEMLRAAVQGGREGSLEYGDASGAHCGILGVSILTSLDGATVGAAWGRPPVDVQAEVLRLAADAAEVEAAGLVCSGHEAGVVHRSFGARLGLLIPGIRLSGGDVHDQRRVMTPAQAAHANARWVVLGRAVTAAANPEAAMHEVLAELQLAKAL